MYNTLVFFLAWPSALWTFSVAEIVTRIFSFIALDIFPPFLVHLNCTTSDSPTRPSAGMTPLPMHVRMPLSTSVDSNHFHISVSLSVHSFVLVLGSENLSLFARLTDGSFLRSILKHNRLRRLGNRTRH